MNQMKYIFWCLHKDNRYATVVAETRYQAGILLPRDWDDCHIVQLCPFRATATPRVLSLENPMNELDPKAVDSILNETANLGLASTSELLAELEARFDTGLDGVTPNALCRTGMQKTREWLTEEELAYRTVKDEPTYSDLDVDPYVEIFIYSFEGQDTFLTTQEPDESILNAIEEGIVTVLKIEEDGTVNQVSENGTITPCPIGLARQIRGFHFELIDPEDTDEDS